jgi:hypothetical protein
MNNKITRPELYLVISNTFLILFLIGGCFNYIVVTNNNNLMPVLADFSYNDSTHFTYKEPLIIKYWFLSDILYFAGNILSIGDSLMIIGFIGYFIFILCFIKKKTKYLTGGKK